MNYELAQTRSFLNGVVGGIGFTGSALGSASDATMSEADYSRLIRQKQMEITELVNATKNKNKKGEAQYHNYKVS